MKKLVIVFCLLLAVGLTAWARSIRVKFPPGRTTVVLKGRTTGGPSESGGMDPIAYEERPRKGQTMNVHITSARKNAFFRVYATGMDLIGRGQRVKVWS